MTRSEQYLEDLRRDYEFETDEELKRKREVHRTHIVRLTQQEIAEDALDLEANQEAYRILSDFIRQREKERQRRELIELLIKWVGLGVAFTSGVVVALVAGG